MNFTTILGVTIFSALFSKHLGPANEVTCFFNLEAVCPLYLRVSVEQNKHNYPTLPGIPDRIGEDSHFDEYDIQLVTDQQ